MKLDILTIPNPILRQKSAPVKQVDSAIVRLLDDMLETMYQANGVGLAAPQVGILSRIVVIDIQAREDEKQPLFFVNPEIVAHSEEQCDGSEGCLSIPNQFAHVKRFNSVTVRFLDRQGQPQEMTAEGFLAIAIQHELDHLDGVLFIDHLSPLKRKMLLKRLEKQRKRG